MKAVVIPVTPYTQNYTIIWCEKTMKGAVSDPGGEVELIQKAIEGPHEDDQFLIDELGEHSVKPGFESARPFTPTRWLKDGDVVSFGDKN